MLITAKTEIVIRNTPEMIWNYATNPANWTASNWEEHFGLKFFTEDNLPRGLSFTNEKVWRAYLMIFAATSWSSIDRASSSGSASRPTSFSMGSSSTESLRGE